MNYYQEIKQTKETYRNKLPKPERGWPPNVRRALKCKQNNMFTEELTVGWMKQQCYITSKNFASQFKYYVGKTPKQYITYHRIEVAKLILSEDELKSIKISDIAYALGFSNPSAFSMTFKKYIGQSPSEFRDGCV